VDRKATVRRFIDEAVNGGRDELVDELVADELRPGARDWFGAFRSSFPDVHMETVELVADGDTVVGRFKCSATHLGEWRGNPPTGRRFEGVDEVYFFRFDGDQIAELWGIETRSTASGSSGWTRPSAPRPVQVPAASMFFVTTSIVRPSSSVGLNSTTSVPA
jgi:predicted ester cyclase